MYVYDVGSRSYLEKGKAIKSVIMKTKMHFYLQIKFIFRKSQDEWATLFSSRKCSLEIAPLNFAVRVVAQFFSMGHSRSLFSLIFSLFKHQYNLIQLTNVNKWTIEYAVLGLELTTSWTWVSYHNDYTRAQLADKLLPLQEDSGSNPFILNFCELLFIIN